MRRYRVCFIGFGNVGRALARLLESKATELRDRYDIECEIAGVATRRTGWRAADTELPNIDEWLATTKPDVVFETTSLNPETGQPAIEYLRKSLQAGAHTITANKAPIVYAYDELNELIVKNGLRNTSGPAYTPLDPTGTKSVSGKSTTTKWQSFYPGIVVLVTVEGQYQDIRRFIRDLEQSKQFVVINQVELQRANENSAPVSAEGGEAAAAPAGSGSRGSLISLQLNLATYFQRESAAPPPQE